MGKCFLCTRSVPVLSSIQACLFFQKSGVVLNLTISLSLTMSFLYNMMICKMSDLELFFITYWILLLKTPHTHTHTHTYIYIYKSKRQNFYRFVQISVQSSSCIRLWNSFIFTNILYSCYYILHLNIVWYYQLYQLCSSVIGEADSHIEYWSCLALNNIVFFV